VNFPPHQLMQPAQNNLSRQPQYRPTPQPSVPQVFIEFYVFRTFQSIGRMEQNPKRVSIYIREYYN
jgi:hypothetical protein